MSDFDSSDEEDTLNTVGNTPLEWYNNSLHIGYDVSGRRIMKPSSKGAVDTFLNNFENADQSFVIRDPNTGQSVLLSEQDILTIKRLCSGRGFVSNPIDDDEYDTGWFTRNVMETPVTAHPPQKRSFIPSVHEKKHISRMVHAIKCGRMKLPELDEHQDELWDSEYDSIVNPHVPDVWRKEFGKIVLKTVSEEYLEWLPKELHPDYQSRFHSIRQIIQPPPIPAPGHEESYNPPEEYLLSEKEIKLAKSRFYDPSYNPHRQNGEKPLIPKVYQNLRSVPFSPAPIYDKLRRIKDLTMAARVVKDKVASSTEKMLKQDIPASSEMRPYPNHIDQHLPINDVILSISVSFCGKFIAVIGYEYLSIYKPVFGHQNAIPMLYLRIPITDINCDWNNSDWTLRNPSVTWNPYSHLLAVAVGSQIRILNVAVDKSRDLEQKMKSWWQTSMDTEEQKSDDEPVKKKSKLENNWSYEADSQKKSFRKISSCFVIKFNEDILDMSWHLCGDYLLTISGKGKATTSGGKVLLHRLSKCASQSPFGDSNSKLWLTARFHCQKNVPLLFLAECNSSFIQVYDIAQKKLVKTLQVVGQPSTMEMHPSENHLVVGTFEGKICWFDLDMGINPYKTLNVNLNSIRSISLHHNYPLMSCTTANGSAVVFYAKVFNTFDKNAIVVAVSLFEKLDKAGDLYAVSFHTQDVRLYCGGADKALKEVISCH